MNDVALFLAVFLACIVEAVEATTIVLAAGATRDWRSAVIGVFTGIVLLGVAVAVAGPAVSLLPLGVLRLVVGGLLLVFGLQWMRKAILRASGYKPLHDEELIYRKQVAAARDAGTRKRFGVTDWYAFTLSFKSVVLEGLEVVFIVLTFGANQQNLPLAAMASGAAVVIVVLLGVAVRGPLSRVPENTLKFVVGVMLTSFGVFWGAEGAGAVWPGADAALLVLVPALAVYALAITWVMRRRRIARTPRPDPSIATTRPDAVSLARGRQPTAPSRSWSDQAQPGGAQASVPVVEATCADSASSPGPHRADLGERIRSFALFWWDFIIGDDWHIAAGVVLALLATFALSGVTPLAWIAVPAAAIVLIPYGIRRAMRSK